MSQRSLSEIADMIERGMYIPSVSPGRTVRDSLAAEIRSAERRLLDEQEDSLRRAAAKMADVDRTERRILEEAAERAEAACRQAVPDPHTYASENVDVYLAAIDSRNRCVKAIRAAILGGKR